MNFLKRAMHSIWYRKRSFLLLFCVFTVLSVLILIGFSVLSACNQQAKALREEIGASVIINNYHTETNDIFYSADLITQEDLRKIESDPLVRGSNPYVFSMAMATEDITPVVTESQADTYSSFENSWMRVEGTSDLSGVADFVAGTVTLAEGREFTKEDTGKVIVSADVAQQSGIEVGDSILIDGYYTEKTYSEYHGSDTTAEVAGIFTINNYLPHTDAAFYNAENVLYVTPDVAFSLNGMDNVYNIKLEISDPLQAEQFVQNIQNMDIEDVEDYQFTIDTTQYRSMQGAIDSMTKLAAIMFAASILMGAVVLVMMLMINLKDREFELGVLLSMGENKAKIIGQMMLESLFPVLCAMTAAVFCGGWMQQIFASLFTTAVDISPTPVTIFEMYLAGILLTLLASCVTVWKVTQYQPKRILMAME